jgi:hypothetical protein
MQIDVGRFQMQSLATCVEIQWELYTYDVEGVGRSPGDADSDI